MVSDMICKNCKSIVSDNDNFCQYCGFPLKSENNEAQKVSPSFEQVKNSLSRIVNEISKTKSSKLKIRVKKGLFILFETLFYLLFFIFITFFIYILFIQESEIVSILDIDQSQLTSGLMDIILKVFWIAKILWLLFSLIILSSAISYSVARLQYNKILKQNKLIENIETLIDDFMKL